MSRFPPIPPSRQTPEQKHAQDEVESLGSVFGNPLASKDNNGTMLGPFLCRPFVSLASVNPTLTHLTPRVRELAILATASSYDAPFVLYAHTRIAHSVGLSSDQVSQAREGNTPAGLDTVEQAAWEFSKRLAGTRGPLDTSTWENARNSLGIEGVANLTHVVGAYAYMCLFQNAADTALPGGQKM
ncbi:MAG: hypothetical protein Q9166_003378 [cf. Caloplaca sp. 2 TL-2023]